MAELISFSRYAFPVLALLIFLLCFSALLKRRPPSLGGARLINAATKEAYPLIRRETSLGRNKNCDIILNYPTVSRVCAVIVCAKTGWYITRVKSETTVTINGKALEKKELLKTNDKITFNSITLIFDNKQG